MACTAIRGYTMTDVEIIGMLKTYVKETLKDAGALEGAPCQIQGIVDNEDGTQTLTFVWKDEDGDSHTTTMDTPSAIYLFTSLTNGQMMVYDSTAGKWVNADMPTVDAALNENSTNAIQNGTVYLALADKVDKVAGKGLSANDFTDALKLIVEGAVSSISVNGVSQTITSNAVDLDVANNLITETQWTAISGLYS